MALDPEIARYDELLPEWLAAGEGKFTLIKGRDLIGVCDDMDDGYRAALDKYGVTSFLLRPISAVQPMLDLTNLYFGVIRVVR